MVRLCSESRACHTDPRWRTIRLRCVHYKCIAGSRHAWAIVIGLCTVYVVGTRRFVDEPVCLAMAKHWKADACARPHARIARAVRLHRMLRRPSRGRLVSTRCRRKKASRLIENGDRARARLTARQGQGCAQTGQGSNHRPSSASRREACASTMKAAACRDGPA